MILYHGSNTTIEKIDLGICKPYKDFGKGFYTSSEKAQAVSMARRTSKIYGGEPWITEFEADEKELKSGDLKSKDFSAPNDEWALFVLHNRNRFFENPNGEDCNHNNQYDMVNGPIANDDLRLLFDLFADRILSLAELAERMKFKRLGFQTSFHTERAVALLKRKEAYKI